MDDFTPILERRSLLSNAEADRRMENDFNENEVLDRPESHKDSLNSFLLGGTEDDEDKILFSYISPGLRKGSWNPTVSFSFESSSRENSNGGVYSKESTFVKEIKSKKVETKLVEDCVISTYLESPSEQDISGIENEVSKDSFTLNADQSNFVTDVDATGLNYEENKNRSLLPSKLGLETNNQELPSVCFIDNVEDLHEMHRRRSLSPKADMQDTIKAMNKRRSMSEETNNSLLDEVAYEEELIYGQIANVSEKKNGQKETGEKHVCISVKKDVLSDDDRVPYELDIDTIGVNNVNRNFCRVNSKSSCSSNTATNKSVRNSIADEEKLVDKIVLEDEQVSNNSDHTIESNGIAQPIVWVGQESSSGKVFYIIKRRFPYSNLSDIIRQYYCHVLLKMLCMQLTMLLDHPHVVPQNLHLDRVFYYIQQFINRYKFTNQFYALISIKF